MPFLKLPLLVFFNPRVLCFLRREYPLSFVIVPVVLGQLIGYELRVAIERNQHTVVMISVLVLVLCVTQLPRHATALSLGVVIMMASLSFRTPATQSSGTFFATLASDPRHRQIGSLEGEFWLRDYPSGEPRGYAVCRGVYLPWRNSAQIRAGDTVVMNASVVPIALPYNPAAYDAGLRRYGITEHCRIKMMTSPITSSPPFFSTLRERLLSRLSLQFGSNERLGLFLSMVLGFRDQIGAETFYAFQASGLAHLLVVSGFHVTLIFMVLLFACRLLVRTCLYSQPAVMGFVLSASCAGALFFVGFIGVDSASLRAAIAVFVVVMSRIFERGTGLSHGIMVAFLALILMWPGCFFEAGVQLTFSALIGIAWGLSCRSPRAWLRHLAVCVAPSITTLGITIAWFKVASLAGMVMNPLCAPIASTAFTIGGLVALLLLLTGIDSSGYVFQSVTWGLVKFKDLVLVIADVPLAIIELPNEWAIPVGIAVSLLVLHLISRHILRYLIEMGVVHV